MESIFYIACVLVSVFMLGVYVGWCIGWRERGECDAASNEPSEEKPHG